MSNQDSGLGKNYWLAMFLSMIILMGYPYLMKKLGHSPRANQPVREVLTNEQADVQKLGIEEAIKEAGAVLEQAQAPSVTTFQNQFYNIEFSTLGGSISKMQYLGEAHLSDTQTIPFYDEKEKKDPLFGLELGNENAELSKTMFNFNQVGPNVFEYSYEKPNEYKIIKTFQIDEAKPIILMNVKILNLSDREKNFPLELCYGLHYEIDNPQKERSLEAVVQGERLVSANHHKIKKKPFYVSGNLDWVGIVKKYFAVLVKPNWPTISNQVTTDEDTMYGRVKMEPITLVAGQEATKEFFIYAGPQRYELLKGLNNGFDNVLSKGFFGIFKLWLLRALKFIYQFAHNFGLAIIFLTLVLKGVFAPLTHMSFENMKKMQALQPKLKSLQERYKKEPEKLNKEMMELYRRNKVNPMGGCLPMVVQIPIFISFYQMLNDAIELKGASLWWIRDLAAPDRLIAFPISLPILGGYLNILPLLMLGSMIWQQKLTPQTATTPEQAQMMNFMPIIFGVMFYSMPSGLVLYWFINNVLSIIQQTIVKRMVVVLHHEDQ